MSVTHRWKDFDERLWMLGLPKWRIIYMSPRLDDIWPWSLPNLT
jgi:hypothetical protein